MVRDLVGKVSAVKLAEEAGGYLAAQRADPHLFRGYVSRKLDTLQISSVIE